LQLLISSAQIISLETLLLPGWIPRRLGGGFGGKKESGQLRFGGKDRPFRKPIILKLTGERFHQESHNGKQKSSTDQTLRVRASDDSSCDSSSSATNMTDQIKVDLDIQTMKLIKVRAAVDEIEVIGLTENVCMKAADTKIILDVGVHREKKENLRSCTVDLEALQENLNGKNKFSPGQLVFNIFIYFCTEIIISFFKK